MLFTETKPFVDMLFKALESHEYLKPTTVEKQPSPPPQPVEPEKEPEVENHGNLTNHGNHGPQGNHGEKCIYL